MNSLLSLYGLCVVALFLKMLAISCYQGYFRLRDKAFVNAEDAIFLGRQPRSQELPQVMRAAKAWANDLENIPSFFVLGALAIALQAPGEASAAAFVGFTCARFLHTLAYLGGWQPWRTLAYGVGMVCLLALVVMVAGACV